MTTLSQPHNTFLTVNGLRLHYFDWGNAGAHLSSVSTGIPPVPRRSTRQPDISRTASTSLSPMSEAMGRVPGLPLGLTNTVIKSVTWKGLSPS